MRFEVPNCPRCGKIAHSTCDIIPGDARILQTDGGGFQYAGETRIWWDAQETVRDSEGRWLLRCEDLHEWYSKTIDDDGLCPSEG